MYTWALLQIPLNSVYSSFITSILLYTIFIYKFPDIYEICKVLQAVVNNHTIKACWHLLLSDILNVFRDSGFTAEGRTTRTKYWVTYSDGWCYGAQIHNSDKKKKKKKSILTDTGKVFPVLVNFTEIHFKGIFFCALWLYVVVFCWGM